MFLFSHLAWVGLLNDSEQYQRRRARVCGVQLLRTRSERVIWNELWIACRVHRDFLENKLCSHWNLTCKALLLPLPPHTFLVVSDLRVLPRFSQGLPSQVPTSDTHQSGQRADVSWQTVPSLKEFIVSIKLKIKIKNKNKKGWCKRCRPTCFNVSMVEAGKEPHSPDFWSGTFQPSVPVCTEVWEFQAPYQWILASYPAYLCGPKHKRRFLISKTKTI